jgi:hypothetical protein
MTYDLRLSLFAHEYGHALGLIHHNSPQTSLMTSPLVNPPYTALTTYDVGLADCAAGFQVYWGIRCIYKWPY